jgi:hypothetical protein
MPAASPRRAASASPLDLHDYACLRPILVAMIRV